MLTAAGHVLPTLEPIAGAGLAVSLAYLALDRFRYRDEVEKHAKAKKHQLRAENDDDTLEVVNDLKWLCRKNCNGHVPRGFWAVIYHHTFRRKLDEFLIAILAALSAFTLIGGVALQASLDWPFKYFDNSGGQTFLFYVCSTAMILPAIAVACGRKCVEWGHRFADHCEEEINKVHKQSARNASPPQTAQTPKITAT